MHSCYERKYAKCPFRPLLGGPLDRTKVKGFAWNATPE